MKIYDRFIRLISPADAVFYTLFNSSAERLPEMANGLLELIRAADEDQAERITTVLARFELANKESKQLILRALAKNFITPISREDIYTLSMALDAVASSIFAAVRSLRWSEVNDRQDALLAHMAAILLHATREVRWLTIELSKPGRPQASRHIQQIHAYRRELELAYDRSMQILYEHEDRFGMFMKKREHYILVRDAGVKCQAVAHVIENIILTHVG